MPWEMMVDSKATTGLWFLTASATSGETSRYLLRFMLLPPVQIKMNGCGISNT